MSSYYFTIFLAIGFAILGDYELSLLFSVIALVLAMRDKK